MTVALIILLVVVGSVAFHMLSPWWWTPIASNWGFIDDTILITFWITGIVFIAVLTFTAYCVLRFRHTKGHKAHYEPESAKLEVWLSVLTSIGVIAMLAPGLIAWQQFITVPEGADEFEVLGQQWIWNYRYPGEDGELGKTDIRNVTAENPFGISPDDPAGQDDILVQGDDLHLPLDRPVKVLLRSLDVPARFLRAPVPRQDGHGARHGYLFLVDADPDRHLRHSLRRALRRWPPRHARPRGRRGGKRLSRLARRAADVCPIDGQGRFRPQASFQIEHQQSAAISPAEERRTKTRTSKWQM